ADGRRLSLAAEVGLVELGRPRHQVLVGALRTPLARLDLGDHPLDPDLLVSLARRGGDQDDDLIALPIGRDRTPAPNAATHLDLRHALNVPGSPRRAAPPSARC